MLISHKIGVIINKIIKKTLCFLTPTQFFIQANLKYYVKLIPAFFQQVFWPFHTNYMAKRRISEFSAEKQFLPRRSPAQDQALGTNTINFEGCSLHVCIKKYKNNVDEIFVCPKIALLLPLTDIASAKSDINGPKEKVCY